MAAAPAAPPLQLYRIDDLPWFAAGRERLALLHLDVEGAEDRALAGGAAVLARDQPLLSVELHVHKKPAQSQALLRQLTALGYDAYFVEEICGMRADCRNLLCVPRSRHASLVGSDALDAALQARAIFPVDAETILQYAFPCCRRGAPCCSGRSCCAHFKVHAYVNRGLRSGTLTSAERMWSTRIRWYYQCNHVVQSAWSHNRVIHNMTV